MVRGGNYDDVAWKLVQLHQQKGYDAFDLTGFVRVSTLFANRIEFVKKQDARPCPDIIEELPKSRIGLPEIASNQGIIPHDEKRQTERLSHRLGEGGFAVTRRSRKENTVARLVTMSAQHVGANMLLDELASALLDRQWQHQLSKLDTRLKFQDRVLTRTRGGGGCGEGRRRYRHSCKCALETISDNVMVLRALFRDQRFGRRFQHSPITGSTGTNQGDEKVASSHRVAFLLPISKFPVTGIVSQISNKVSICPAGQAHHWHF